MSKPLEGQQDLPLDGDVVASRALAKIGQPDGEMMAVVFGQLANKELHNFKGKPSEVFRLISLATGPACKKSDEALNQTIAIRFWYVHRIELEAMQGGEINEVSRVVLITPKLDAYAFVSDGITKDLARIVNFFGLGPYDPPIEVKVTPIKTRRGFTTLTLTPA